MYWVAKLIFPICCLLLFISVPASASAQDPSSVVASAEFSEEDAIRQPLRRYVDAFNKRDFDQLASLLSPNVVFQDKSSDIQIEGAEVFLEKLKESTIAEPTLRLEAEISEVVVGDDQTATVKGFASLNAEGVPDEVAQFVVTLSVLESEWKINSIVEHTAAIPLMMTASEAIESLVWLVGKWQEDSPQQLQVEFEYLPGNQFLRRSIIEPSNQQELGFELIGYDPNLNLVRSWSYYYDGSFGSGFWRGAGDHWNLTMTQTLIDGTVANGTYIIRPTDENTMVVKLVSQEIGGELQPSGKTVTLSRQKSTEPAQPVDEDK